jgi:hypothetical protein
LKDTKLTNAKISEKTYDFSIFFEEDNYNKCKILKTVYTNNKNTALGILNDNNEIELLLTANLDFKLPEKKVLLKDYAENKGIVQELLDNKIVKLTGIKYHSGFVELIEAEILNFDDYKINFEG